MCFCTYGMVEMLACDNSNDNDYDDDVDGGTNTTYRALLCSSSQNTHNRQSTSYLL